MFEKSDNNTHINEELMKSNNEEENSLQSTSSTTVVKVQQQEQQNEEKESTQHVSNQLNRKMRRRKRSRSGSNGKVVLLHSQEYTNVLYSFMKDINGDRDVLLSALLDYCGFVYNPPKFFHIIPPKKATISHLQQYHDKHYLDLLSSSSLPQLLPSSSPLSSSMINDDLHHHHCQEYVYNNNRNNDEDNERHDSTDQYSYNKLLESMGLTDDCSLPSSTKERELLWTYCQYVAGASLQAANLLVTRKSPSPSSSSSNGGNNKTRHETEAESTTTQRIDVAINWGGGRHHAFANKANGFCYVNDAVLAIKHMQKFCNRILYVDLDIHHGDGVQDAFYDTNNVLTVSLHRYESGFFPSKTGSTNEKGKYNTPGVGYNLNIPLPRNCNDYDFCYMYQYVIDKLLDAYDPDVIVLCIGADGLANDPLVTKTDDGWSLNPEALAECVRYTSIICSGNDKVGSEESDIEDSCDTFSDNNTMTTDKELSQCEDSENIAGTDRKKTTQKRNVQEIAIENCKDKTMQNGRLPITMTNATTKISQSVEVKMKKRRKRKLLILGGGGYNPTETARTYLLCTAAACEGSRPGMLWNELPKDVPRHQYFPRYGPSFELLSKDWKLDDNTSICTDETKRISTTSGENETKDMHRIFQKIEKSFSSSKIRGNSQYESVLVEGRKAVDLAVLYISSKQREETEEILFSFSTSSSSDCIDDNVFVQSLSTSERGDHQKERKGGRRRRRKKNHHSNCVGNLPVQEEMLSSSNKRRITKYAGEKSTSEKENRDAM